MNSVLIYNARLLDESIDGPGAIFLLNGKIRSVFQGYYTNLDTLKSFVDSILLEECILHDFISLELVEVCFVAQDKAEDS